MPEDLIGWDIGGAHLKAARVASNGSVLNAIQIPCALWRGLNELTAAIDAVTTQLGDAMHHHVTMTGEMVDLFADREAGVMVIARTIHDRFSRADVSFYCGGTVFVPYSRVKDNAHHIASANWRASVEFAAKKVEHCLFVDIGSTTSDLIAIDRGSPCILGYDDYSRLISGELVYTGVVRTPLMALGESVSFRGAPVPLMAELFASTADVYRVLRQLPDDADQHPTADGAEKSAIASARRIARMIGRDLESADWEAWYEMAGAFRAAQIAKIETASRLVASRAGLENQATIVGAGVGQFLIRDIAARMGCEYRSFADLVNCESVDKHTVANIAPAVAVALLGLCR
jgi:(4-(4-[2-(gamma-L-glutamylamino)ethyl]phenoxymethyl)furan-2-yl)methanamine synthase